MQILLNLILVSITALGGCVAREPVTVVFTGDVKGRIRPAG